MNKILKRFLTTALIVTLILSGTLTSFGAESAGIKVQYNGNDITFSGASAKIIDGKAMLPLQQTFTAIGAKVPADVSTTDPYISARELGEKLGYCIGWDAAEKTVVIIDPSVLLANADKDFSIISMLAKSNIDMEKAYATTGKFNMEFTAYGQPDSLLSGMSYSIAGKMSGVQQKSSSDLDMSLAINFDKMLAAMPVEQQAMIAPFLKMFENVDMKIKTNGETGETYMNSSLFSMMTGQAGNNVWYKMNVYEPYEKMGIDMSSIAQMGYSEEKLSAMMKASLLQVDDLDAASYQEMKTTYLFLNELFGNDAFDSRTTSGITTNSLVINQETLMNALNNIALTEGVTEDSLDMAEIGEYLKTSELGASITIQEKEGALYHYTVNGNFKSEDGSGLFKLSGDPKNVEYNVTIDQKDTMKIVMSVISHIAETSEAPDLSLPDNATVLDYPMYPAN